MATIKTVVKLKSLQSSALVRQTMMTHCPVRAVMTEIYTLLLELGPFELPSEIPSSVQQVQRREKSAAEQQIAANALNHQQQDKIIVFAKVHLLPLCTCKMHKSKGQIARKSF